MAELKFPQKLRVLAALQPGAYIDRQNLLKIVRALEASDKIVREIEILIADMKAAQERRDEIVYGFMRDLCVSTAVLTACLWHFLLS